MKKHLITITTTLSAILIVSTATYAIGTLTPTGTAGDNTQYSLNDIYDKLTNFSDTPTATSSPFTLPGSVSASFHTLSEIYGLLEAEEADLVAENIKDGTTIFGIEGTLTSSEPGLPTSGQTTSYATGDDGDLEAGIAMSYTDNNDGTITDNVTGLVWQKDGTYNASWSDAVSYCLNNTPTLPGTGWRLANIKELQSIVDYGVNDPSINAVFTSAVGNYWSNTLYSSNTAKSLVINTNSFVTASFTMFGTASVRCVR